MSIQSETFNVPPEISIVPLVIFKSAVLFVAYPIFTVPPSISIVPPSSSCSELLFLDVFKEPEVICKVPPSTTILSSKLTAHPPIKKVPVFEDCNHK